MFETLIQIYNYIRGPCIFHQKKTKYIATIFEKTDDKRKFVVTSN